MPRATMLRATEEPHLKLTVVDEERQALDLRVVVPVLDGQDNILLLLTALVISLDGTGRSYEVIIIDDGSTDETYPRLARQAELDHRVRFVKLRRKLGQLRRRCRRFRSCSRRSDRHARRRILEQPQPMRILLEKLDEGYDLVSGWRQTGKTTWRDASRHESPTGSSDS